MASYGLYGAFGGTQPLGFGLLLKSSDMPLRDGILAFDLNDFREYTGSLEEYNKVARMQQDVTNVREKIGFSLTLCGKK